MKLHLLAVLVPLLTACGGGSSSNAFYARFESLGPSPINAYGPAMIADFAGELFYSVGDGLYVVGEEAPRLAGVTLLTALPDALIVQANGELLRSTDAQTFETVGTEPVTALVAVGDALVAGRLSGSGTGALLRSTDAGATWTSLGDLTLDNGVEGGSEGLVLSAAVDGLVWAQLSGDADLGDNWQYEGATFEVRGEAVTRLSDVFGAPAFPAGVTPDGRVIVDVHADAVSGELNRPTDELPIAIVRTYRPGMSFEGEQLLSYAMPQMPEVTPVPRVLGLDTSGRLLTTLDRTLARTELPLTLANDQRDQVLAGPGCKERDSFDGFNGSDRPDVRVSNTTAEPVTVWAIDQQYRWHAQAELGPGASDSVSGFGLVEGAFLMVLRQSGDCAYGHFVKAGAGPIDVTIE